MGTRGALTTTLCTSLALWALACGSESTPSDTAAGGSTTTGTGAPASGGSAATTGATGGGGTAGGPPATSERLRVAIETDLGGDRDDQASFIRFLLYSNAWDVEAILIDRHPNDFQQDGAAANPTNATDARDMAHDYIERYRQAHLQVHDPRYPSADALEAVTLVAHDGSSDGVMKLVELLHKEDDRPLWYGNWGSNSGTESNLGRALQWFQDNDPGQYATAVSRLRVVTLDGASPRIPEPMAAAIPLYVETGWPQLGGGIETRWYRRFDDITGDYIDGADIHLFGELYTGEKEGDSWTFVYLLNLGATDPEHPTWGGLAGRYRERTLGPNHYWNDAQDTWNGETNRDNTAARWAEALQNDFKARLDWCVAESYGDANHPPALMLEGRAAAEPLRIATEAGAELTLSLEGTTDPDGDTLAYGWTDYPEAGSYGPLSLDVSGPTLTLQIPQDAAGTQLHVIATVRDDGSPALTRYRRVVLDVAP